MISAEEFIDILEKKDLLDPELVNELRRRVEQSMAPVSAALLAKRLVDKGHLSRKLAQRLLDRAESEPMEEVSKPQEHVEQADGAAPLGLAPLEEDEEVEEEVVEEEVNLEMTEEEDWGLMELEEDRPSPSIPPAPAPPVQPAAPVQPAMPVRPAVPVQPAMPVQPAVPVQPATPVQPAIPVSPAAPIVDGLEEIEEIIEPLDALDAAALTGEPLEGPLESPRPGRRGRRKKGDKAPHKGNVWDSSLVLIGGGTLLFLIIIMVVLFVVLKGRGADDILAQANDYYAAGSYTKAEDSYSKLLEKFPKHPGAGLARVKLSLSKMRQVVGSDWPRALEAAQTEIPLISGEETFAAEARPELASMLPDIADGLANKAHSTQDAQLADLAEEGLALVEKYVPSSARPQDRLQDIEAVIALTRLEIARGERLRETVEAIVKAAEEGRTQEGYELRRGLLKEYPTLFEDSNLSDAIRIVSQAEQAAVERIAKSVSAITTEPETKAVATIALAQRSPGSPVSGVGEERVFAVAGGAVYGLEAIEGKVLWRREVGFEANVRGPLFPPTPISERPGADPLLVSRSRQEVLRVEASTGKICWRFPVGEPFDAHPVVFGSRVLVATRSGRLVSVDIESGNSSEYIQMPQALRVGPAADSTRNAIYQIGEHSSLFVLSAADGTCTSVIYLGHESGTIVVPPVRVSRYLLVCENDGVRDSVLKVLDLDPKPSEEEESPPVRVVQEVRLDGHVYTTPIVSGPQVLLATDAGTISLFQVTGAEGKDPLSLSAQGATAGENQTDLVRYASMASGRLWIADSQLTQYAIRSAESRLKSTWIANERSISRQPPIVLGRAVIHVRSRLNLPGVVVSAVGVEKGESLWETVLAAPSAGVPIADSNTNSVLATTSIGGVFQMEPPEKGQVALRDQPTQAVPSRELSGPIERIVPLANGMLALIPGGDPKDIPVFEPGKTASESRIRTLLLESPLSGEAISFAGGILAPTQGGQVFLIDPRTEEEIAAPFQPTLEAGRKYRWSRPAVVGSDQFVIADDAGGLHRVMGKSQPTKHLAGAVTVRLDDPIVSPVAVLGEHVYAVDRADSLVRVDLPGLTDRTQQPLGAKCVIGPLAIGDRVMLVTNDDLMHIIDSSGKDHAVPLPHGRPVGEPVVDGSAWLFASTGGMVWRVDPATAEELAAQDTGLALGSGLAPLGNRLMVAGHDGTLYLIEKP